MAVLIISSIGSRLNWLWALVILVAAGAGMWYGFRPAALPKGVSAVEFHNAERQFRDSYHRSPTRNDTLSLLGETSVNASHLETALACFQAIPSTDSQYGLAARLQQAQVCKRLNRARDAEANFREFLALTSRHSAPPQHVRIAYEQLVYLLAVELRFETRHDVLIDMHALQLADVFDSKQLYFPNLLIWNSAAARHRLRDYLERDPQDVELNIAQGRYLAAEGKLSEARQHLELWYRNNPANLHCLAALLECSFEQNDWKQFDQLAAALPEYQDAEPWLLTRMRGEFANHSRDWNGALVQFERLQRADPAHPLVQTGLARAYAGLKDQAARARALKRSLVLSQIRVDLATVKEDNPQPALALAKLCDQAELAEAADTFRKHAARIKSTLQRRVAPTTGGQP